MIQIKALAPTIIYALKAVEQGCRKVQDDPSFVVDMSAWMTLQGPVCMGCLATSTFIHLSNKSAKEIVNSFPPTNAPASKYLSERAFAYGFEVKRADAAFSQFSSFEASIDSLRRGELHSLLEFYQLQHHPNAYEAEKWLLDNHTIWLNSSATKTDLLRYADFLKELLIPKMEQWFAPLLIKELAPTILDAIKAVEIGCRKIQDDPHYEPEMLYWMTIMDDVCYGCLSTVTLLQLTGKTGKEVANSFSPGDLICEKGTYARASAFGIRAERFTACHSEFRLFELAIDSFRKYELLPLLEFYNLAEHENAELAKLWFFEYKANTIGYGTTKIKMLEYANFLKEVVIPAMQEWFAPDK